jgi:hypothetical protein
MDRSPVDFALRASPVIAAGIGLCVLAVFGPGPAAGFAIGTALSWGSFFLAKLLVASSVSERNTKLTAQAKLQLALLLKLPLFAIVIFFTNSLGRGAVTAFLGGYLLVYFPLVLGAFLCRERPISSDERR